MKVTLSTIAGEVFVLDIPADIELENLKALAAFEVGIPATEMLLMHEMKPLLDDKKPVSLLGVREGDILLVQHMVAPPAPAAAAPSQPGGSQATQRPDPATLRDMLIKHPEQLALLRHNYPKLAEAFDKGLDEFSRVIREMEDDHAQRELAKYKLLTADPFDPETQKLIAEEIERKNIESNMEAAMEYQPESFGTVVMLYINCRVNGHSVKAFVDSGAQCTIMSSACAERCGIMRLVDRRWAAIAKGVGTQKIIGRIHLTQLQIENDFLTTSFSVLEDQPIDMLLGLDMLKRLQCSIDLKNNCLIIGTTGTKTFFLNESDLPAHLRHSENLAENEDQALQRALENSAREAGASTSGGDPGPRYATEKTIKEIEALGFKRQDAILELEKSKGDKNQALSVLFAKSFTVPKKTDG